MSRPLPVAQAAARGAAAYAQMNRSARVLGAGPHELVCILYDELGLALSVARRAAVRQDRRGFDAELGRARMLLSSLDAGLDRSSGGAMAQSLSQVYEAMLFQLGRLQMNSAEPALAALHAAVTDLAQAWQGIVPTARNL